MHTLGNTGREPQRYAKTALPVYAHVCVCVYVCIHVCECACVCVSHRVTEEAASVMRLNTELQSRQPEAKRLIEAAAERQQVLQVG